MDKGGVEKIIELVSPAYQLVPYIGAVMIGRFVYYAHVLKRWPTLTEWVLEPSLVGFLGLVCSGGMISIGIDHPWAIGAASALGGVYGVKGIGMICNAILSRISGKEGCVVHDLIEPKGKKDDSK